MHPPHGRFTITGKLIVAYLGVSILHGLWDSMHSVALYLTLLLTEGERLRPSPQGLAIISIIGIASLVLLWRRSARLNRVAPPIPVPPSRYGTRR